MKLSVIIILILISCSTLLAQSNDSLKLYTSKPVPVYTQDYMRKYNQTKRLILKVYPYALYAADVLDEINNNASAIEKRRKQNKFYKDSYQQLKDDFKYVIYELYTSEGIMLMKLVHRETGLTVYEIASQYRGKRNAEMFELMGKLWDQDVHIKYDPSGVDKIAEHVISDIKAGIVPFNDEVQFLTKDEYKVEQEKDKERKKSNKKNGKNESKRSNSKDKK